MKTIIDRAIEEYDRVFEREAYIKGATEQQAIDINKAVEWLNANWRKYIDTDADGMIRFAGWKGDFAKSIKDE